jgi:D-aminopeptidase
MSPQKARESIRKTVAEACGNINQITPLKIEPPYEQEIRVLEGQSIEGYLRRGAARIDDRTVVKCADSICELFI